jgi:hypothetical protein
VAAIGGGVAGSGWERPIHQSISSAPTPMPNAPTLAILARDDGWAGRSGGVEPGAPGEVLSSGRSS